MIPEGPAHQTWDGGSGFGRIRADYEQPAGHTFCGILHSVWAFWAYRNGFRIRTDSVESRIRTDSDGFQDPKYGSRQPSIKPNTHVIEMYYQQALRAVCA